MEKAKIVIKKEGKKEQIKSTLYLSPEIEGKLKVKIKQSGKSRPQFLEELISQALDILEIEE